MPSVPTETFRDLGLPEPILAALTAQGMAQPFPIQSATIRDALAGCDIAACAPTGSGKTLAFGLPMVARTALASARRPTSLILTPTRELAAQIRRDLAPYGKATDRQIFAVYGGVRYGAQIEWLTRGVDVLVATPGRLEDLIEQGAVDLGDVAIVTVDEADRMADLGFLPSVRRILDRTAADRQTLLFSATLDGDVGVLMREYQRDPVRHDAPGAGSTRIDATHHFWQVAREDKVRHAADAIRRAGSTIVFTRTRHGADRLARRLHADGVRAVAMHGGRSQAQRTRALSDFADGAVDALVATDVAARGIHIDDVDVVLHFDPPNGHKDYVHRSGRTARAGATGAVVSLVLPAERRAVDRIKRNLDLDVPTGAPDPARLSTARRPGRQVPDGVRTPQPDRPAGRSRRTSDTRRATKSDAPPQRPPDASGAGIFVRNLPWSTTDDDLTRLFRRHGTVRSASIARDRRGRSKGIGVVRMDPAGATRAVAEMNGRKVKGRRIEVRPER